MNHDAVFWGAIISVVIAVVVFGYLMMKIGSWMKQDAEKNKH